MHITIRILCSLFILVSVISCTKRVEPTTVKVKDPVRHYYPILTGQTLTVIYALENTGKEALVIREIQACCGCTADNDKTTKIILPGKEGYIVLKYNSDKNIGFVEQKIRIYGNIKPKGILELTYDVNVVPHADYTRDYEELYNIRMQKEKPVERLVNGNEAQKGYYVDLDFAR